MQRIKSVWLVRLSVAGIVTLVLSVSSAPGVAAATQAHPEISQLADLAQRYLQGRADRITNVAVAFSDLSTVSTAPELGSRLMENAAELDARRQRFRAANGGYSRADVSVVGGTIVESGAKSTLELTERTKLFFEVVHPGAPSYEEYQLPHTFKFAYSAGIWRLDDVHAHLDDGLPPATEVSTERTPHQPTSSRAGDRQPIATSPTVTAPLGGSTEVKPKAGTVGTQAYNYQAMWDYAESHWSSYNSNYRAYSQDCTNFISQIMQAGGWGYVGFWPWEHADNSKWFYGVDTAWTSYTWAGAENWYWFAQHYSARTTHIEYMYQVLTTDVIQADWDNNNIIDHTMFVWDHSESGGYVELYMAYHTPNTHNRRITDILAQEPNAWYYAHRT